MFKKIVLLSSLYIVVSSIIDLEWYNISKSDVVISGFSSGASFASQYHVVYSKELKGMASFAGVVYGCSSENGFGDINTCLENPDESDVNLAIQFTEANALAGTIDLPENMNDSKVFLYAGMNDTMVNPGCSDKMFDYYSHYGAEIKTQFTIPAVHAQPTNGTMYSNDCSFYGPYYINDCEYDGAFDSLNYIYDGNLQPPREGNALAGIFDEFDQSVVFESSDPSSAVMDQYGYIYIPSNCQDKRTQCKLNVVLHGCLQGRSEIGDIFCLGTGYLEVGEANNIITMFPQVIKSLKNVFGCWDWWGYTDDKYATNLGLQTSAVNKMVHLLIDEV